jgi:hypothetical protein
MLHGHAICTSAADPESVIIAVRMGLFRSRDMGTTWEDLRGRPRRYQALSIRPMTNAPVGPHRRQ